MLADLQPAEVEFLRIGIKHALGACRQNEHWAGYVVDRNNGLLRLTPQVDLELRGDLARLCKTIGWAVEDAPPTFASPAKIDPLVPRLAGEVTSLDEGLAAMSRVLRLRFGAKGKVIFDLSTGTFRIKSKGRKSHGQ